MDITIKKALTYNGVSLQPGQSARIPDADALALIASHSAIPSNQAADKDERLLSQIQTVGLAQYAYDAFGNPIGLLDPNGKSNLLSGPSSKYKFFVPAQQFIGSGVPKDKSLNAAVLSLRSLTDAEAWANPGYVTTVAGSGSKSVSVPANKFAFDLATQSVIFSMRMKKAAPVGSEIIAGCGDAAATQGFYLSMRAAVGGVSKVRPVLNTSGGVVSALADSTATFGEATATDHVLTLAIDAPTKSLFLFCDGTLSNTYSNAYSGSTNITVPFALGAANGSAGTPTSIDMQSSGIHFLSWTGGLPLNIGLVAQLLAANPHRFLTDADLQF